MVVDIEGILQRKAVLEVAVHDARVFDHVDVFGWPSCGQI